MSNNPRLVWNSGLFVNPSFEGEGATGVIPLSWSKLGDGDNASTLQKETGTREAEFGRFYAESDVLGTDTEMDSFQEVSIAVADLAVNDKYFLGVWVQSSSSTMSGRIRLATQTAADADIDSAEQTFTATTTFQFITLELTLATLASYDHFRITVRNETTGAQQLFFDDIVFGKILDFPKVQGIVGNTNIINIAQRLFEPIDNASASGIVESLRVGREDFFFDIEIISFTQAFYNDLFEFWKYARDGGSSRFSFFLDKDAFNLKDFHFPFCVLEPQDWAPVFRLGLVRYNITLACRNILPFALA